MKMPAPVSGGLAAVPKFFQKCFSHLSGDGIHISYTTEALHNDCAGDCECGPVHTVLYLPSFIQQTLLSKVRNKQGTLQFISTFYLFRKHFKVKQSFFRWEGQSLERLGVKGLAQKPNGDITLPNLGFELATFQ